MTEDWMVELTKICIWILLSTLGGLLVLLGALKIAVRWAHWRLALAERRYEMQKVATAESLAKLENTQRFFNTWNLAPAPEPVLVKLCCLKAKPCERHVPQ